MKLTGKRIVITGASSGIGAAMARQAAAQGARLVLVARRAARLEEVARACRAAGGQAAVVTADLSNEAGCRDMIAAALSALGGLDLLILNAGISCHVRVADVRDPAVFSELMAMNYLGPVHCAWLALDALRESRGGIVVVSSLQGKAGFPRSAPHAASKHALHGFFDRYARSSTARGCASPSPARARSTRRSATAARSARTRRAA